MMDKKISVDYDEYLNLYSLVDKYRLETGRLTKVIQEKDDFLSKIKEKAEEVLVIKIENGKEDFSFKSTEKELLQQVVDLYSTSQENLLELTKLNEINLNSLKDMDKDLFEVREEFSDSVSKNSELVEEIGFLTTRSLRGRILNNKYHKKEEVV